MASFLSEHNDHNHFFTPLVILLASLVYYLSYARYGFIISDWGMILLASEKFMNGEIFYKDFSMLYTPGIYLVTAAVFKILGVSVSSATIGWSIIRAFNCVLIYLIGLEMVSRKKALILPLLLWFVPGSLHKGNFIFFVLLSILLLLKSLKVETLIFYFLAGIIATVIALFRVDLSGFFIIGFLLIEILKLFVFQKNSETLQVSAFSKRIVLFGIGALVIAVPVLYYLYSHSALHEAYSQTVAYTSAIKSVWFELPPLNELMSFKIPVLYKYIGLTLPFVLYFFVFVLILSIVISKDFLEKDIKLLIVFLFGCMTLNQAIVYPGVSRISLILPPVLISTLYFIFRNNNQKNRNAIKFPLIHRISLSGLVCLIFSYLLVCIMISDPYINGSFLMRFYNKTLLSDPRLNIYTEKKDADEFNGVIDVIRSTTEEDEYIFTYPNNSQMFHFVTGRKTLEKYSTISEYLHSVERQKAVINILEQNQVRIIISKLFEKRKREDWAPLVDEYVMKTYSPRQKIGKYTFLVRNEGSYSRKVWNRDY